MPIDYGWTDASPTPMQRTTGPRPSPTLAGTLNAFGAGDTAPTGLVIPGAQNAPAPADPGVVDFNRLGRLGMSGVGAALSLPRLMAWNAGPALVGRSGQGPQTGAELLGRLGMDQGSGLTQALGVGAEMVADPMMLMGGMLGRTSRAAAPAESAAGGIAQRLEQFAGSGLADRLATEQATATLPQLAHGTRSAPNAPFSPRSSFWPRVPATPDRVAPVPYRPITPRLNTEQLRADSLNASSFIPPVPETSTVATPALRISGGTKPPPTREAAWTHRDLSGGRGGLFEDAALPPELPYEFFQGETPLATRSFMQPSVAATVPEQSNSIAARLQRLVGR